MKLEIERDLVQAVVNYLKTQPFEHVHALIGALLKCEPPKTGDADGGNNEDQSD